MTSKTAFVRGALQVVQVTETLNRQATLANGVTLFDTASPPAETYPDWYGASPLSERVRLRITKTYRSVGGAFLGKTFTRSSIVFLSQGRQAASGHLAYGGDITLPLTLSAQGEYSLTYRTDPDITPTERDNQWMIHLGDDT